MTGDYFSDVNKNIVSDYRPTSNEYGIKNIVFDSAKGEYIDTDKDVRQQTHEWTYEIYIDPTQETSKKLIIPLDEQFKNQEPIGYFRWYDWNTDYGSEHLTTVNGTVLTEQYVDGTGKSRGLMAVSMGEKPAYSVKTDPTIDNVGVYFIPPEGDWDEIVIACDVSKYCDGLDLSECYMLYEPTISYRYKYIIRPAKTIADAIKKGVDNSKDYLLENHGDVTIGISGKGSTASLRLNLSSVDNYYFYPYTLVYDKETGERSESWENNVVQAQKIFWRIYDSSGLYYYEVDGTSKGGLFFELSQTNIKSGTEEEVYRHRVSGVTTKKTFNIGEPFYVFAYASNTDKSKSCPVARFNCRFSENTPVLLRELDTESEYRTRPIEYLDEHYTRVGLISFDVEEGSSLEHPTFPLDNLNPMPFKWNRSHYGYCYSQLYSDLTGVKGSTGGAYTGISPLHGDYTLVKSIGLDNVSEDGSNDGYQKVWFAADINNPLRDLTYRYTSGNQSGYFLYVDASDESRPIVNVAFEGEMCVGSTLILSAMVANMTVETPPQLIFKLYGIKTDIEGNETERKLVHSFATCSFKTVNADLTNN